MDLTFASTMSISPDAIWSYTPIAASCKNSSRLDGGTARVADPGADRAGSARTRAQLLLFLGVASEAPRLDHDASVACAGCVHAA